MEVVTAISMLTYPLLLPAMMTMWFFEKCSDRGGPIVPFLFCILFLFRMPNNTSEATFLMILLYGLVRIESNRSAD